MANNHITIPENLQADIGLLISLLKIDGVVIDERILQTYEAGGYASCTKEQMAFDTPEVSPPPAGENSVEEVAESTSHQLELPFVFPILPGSVPDFVPALCDGCMQSVTPRRFVFAYGRTSSWKQAWSECLELCVSQNGVILTCSPEMMNDVVNVLTERDLAKQCVVCRDKTCAAKHSDPCVISTDTLQEMNLNELFVTERPILIVDNSAKWTVTWQWLVFFPTFHIASGRTRVVVTCRLLRLRVGGDRAHRADQHAPRHLQL